MAFDSAMNTGTSSARAANGFPLPAVQRVACCGQIHLRANNAQQAMVVPGLLDEIARAAPHGLDGDFHAAPRGHHHDWQCAVQPAARWRAGQCLPGPRWCRVVVQVHQHDVEFVALHRFQRRSSDW